MKIIINQDFGGYSLSAYAMHAYLQKKGIQYEVELNERGSSLFYRPDLDKEDENYYLWDLDIERNDPVLVEVVEELGEKANGLYSSLKVVEIPDDVEWEIAEYDGMEHIAEKHRQWR